MGPRSGSPMTAKATAAPVAVTPRSADGLRHLEWGRLQVSQSPPAVAATPSMIMAVAISAPEASTA